MAVMVSGLDPGWQKQPEAEKCHTVRCRARLSVLHIAQVESLASLGLTRKCVARKWRRPLRALFPKTVLLYCNSLQLAKAKIHGSQKDKYLEF